jgi:MOSC domain-containing protein YiiM
VFFAAPMLRKLNINEDRQTGLTVHGGEDKAMYTYAKKDQEYRNYRSEYYEL